MSQPKEKIGKGLDQAIRKSPEEGAASEQSKIISTRYLLLKNATCRRF